MFNIVLLEDDTDQIDSYKQALIDDGLNSDYKLLVATNVDTAEKLIKKHKINGAILDLEVPQKKGGMKNTGHGSDYLKILLKEKQFPIIIVSSNLKSLLVKAPNLPKHIEKMTRKADVHSKVFEYFEKKKELLEISALFFTTLKEIHTDYQKAFVEVWENWEKINYLFVSEKGKETKKFLKRYIFNYLIEEWMATGLFNEIHHTEFYTYLPRKNRINTGDIIKQDREYWMVITAPCNLANKYPKELALLRCTEIKLSEKKYQKIFNPFRGTDTASQKTKIIEARELFTKQEDGHHYLPPWKKNGLPFKVEFKNFKTIPFDTIRKQNVIKSNREASLSHHFMPHLLQRYGSYVSRIGQPDINIEDYIKHLLSLPQASK